MSCASGGGGGKSFLAGFWRAYFSIRPISVTFQLHQHMRFLALCIYVLVLAPGLYLYSREELECRASRNVYLAALRKIK